MALVKSGGRAKGTLNKDTKMVKDAIDSVYQGVGGNDYLLKFAQDNPEVFLTRIWVKLLPMQFNVKVNNDFASILNAARDRAITIVDGNRVI